MVELLSPQLRGFLDELVPPRPAELQAMEAYARQTGFPILRKVCVNSPAASRSPRAGSSQSYPSTTG